MRADEAKKLTKEASVVPTTTRYIREIDVAIENAARCGRSSVETERMKWECVLELKEYYKYRGYFVSKHNTTDLDNAPYTVGYLTIRWM